MGPRFVNVMEALKMKKIISLLFLLFLFIPLYSLPALQEKVEFYEKTFPIDSATPVFLEFRDVDGNLFFSPSDENQVRIRVKKEIKTRNGQRAEELLKETKVEVSQRGNHIAIQIQYPKFRGIFFWLSDYQRIRVSSEITLPHSSRLFCRLVDGSIHGQALKGEIDLKTVDGSIDLTQVQGSVKTETVDGRISLRAVEGNIQAETVDGDIIVSGQINRLELRTVDGDIEVTLSPLSSMERPWRLTTVDGDVDLLLPADFSAELFLQSGDGHIQCEFPLTTTGILSKRKISGKLNKGGPLLSIKTGDGDIVLRKSID